LSSNGSVDLCKYFVLLLWPTFMGLSRPWSYGSWIYNCLCNQCLSPLMLWVRISIRARCTILCDKVCQWFATGWWFSPGPTVSSINKTDRHDITEILLKVALNTIKPSKQSTSRLCLMSYCTSLCFCWLSNYQRFTICNDVSDT
jgi:hypothetical protein